jgi:hypothetical protein
MPRKSEVYSWRVSRALKSGLEEAARAQRRSVAGILDEIVASYLEPAERAGGEAERQRRLHLRAARLAGLIAGTDPRRAENATDRIRKRLRRSTRAR